MATAHAVSADSSADIMNHIADQKYTEESCFKHFSAKSAANCWLRFQVLQWQRDLGEDRSMERRGLKEPFDDKYQFLACDSDFEQINRMPVLRHSKHDGSSDDFEDYLVIDMPLRDSNCRCGYFIFLCTSQLCLHRKLRLCLGKHSTAVSPCGSTIRVLDAATVVSCWFLTGLLQCKRNIMTHGIINS